MAVFTATLGFLYLKTKLFNCPNCGAPIEKDICPYCGTVFLDWASFDVKRPTFVKVRDHRGHIALMKLQLTHIQETYDIDSTTFYTDDRPIITLNAQPTIKFNADFEAVPFKHALVGKNVLRINIDPEVADEDSKRDVLQGVINESY